MDAITTIEKEGFTGKLYVDDFPESPREWDNLGTMVCFHSNYGLGDKHNYEDSEVFMYELFVNAIGDSDKAEKLAKKWEDSFDKDNNPVPMYEAYREWLFETIEKHYIYLPLYLYNHSGITMNTTGFSCGRDSGQVGYVYVSKAKIRKVYGWKNITKKRIAIIEDYLRSKVKTYDEYLRGDIYIVSIENKDGDEIETCGGYYGQDYAEQGLNFTLDCIVKNKNEKDFPLLINRGVEIPEYNKAVKN